ncbi:ABC-F family ATP-binding cassette domain-containing protein [Silvibacterium dinghuense]|uniref:ABC transporter ATP-binding protein n=1 Tax=Silvibacterium dinghuense TaxID=1560006 RepID=A0A4Q1SJ86_9BACT|nr:ABC-F family ATP-binding cassette domain-containing protein [Silvibacterium dinghuense]RXS97698.1 ABC transporter ATP-binding protein [Silvibacterium dinghuense]GGH01254.1 ABC transporter ATP-binding protein [Silvibacterium dinghuense]
MLQLSGAGKRFGTKLLFEEADWLITANERTALVGANGTGKSTLMKVLAGVESVGGLDYGTLQRTRGMTIGYLPQDGLALSGRSVFDECLSVFDGLIAMEKEMETLTVALSELDHTSSEYAAAADRYSHIDAQFRAHDGYALDAQVGTVLTGLGFSKTDWTRQTEEFSGGWQMRIALAKLLLQKPSLLLLDEPTNHLDIEARDWLEGYLKTYPNGYILISHDRYFLDVTVDKIVELWNKRINVYHGNYEKYLSQKAERMAQLQAAYKNQKEHIEHLEAFISRFRYQATKAKQVQSRIKELEKIERIEIPEEEPVIHFTFPQPPPSGRTVVEVSGLSKSFGPKQVLNDVSFTIDRGDRIALVGVNGAGKSTLVKLLSGDDTPTSGVLKLGHNVLADYFAQDQYKVLDPDARMLDDISKTALKVPEAELRGLLGCFLFSGDDVFKRLGVLSGGERNRYALAKILVSPANFLLLDEPTNHLDLRAKDVLLEAIQNFTGTVIFVSHDRYFIDRIATRVFEVADGKVHVFPGGYEDYLWRKEGGAAELAAATAAAAKVPVVVAAPVVVPEPVATPEPAKKRVNPIKLKQMQERLAAVEEEMPQLEAAISETETALGNFVSAEETTRLSGVLEGLRQMQSSLTEEWEGLMLELEEA